MTNRLTPAPLRPLLTALALTLLAACGESARQGALNVPLAPGARAVVCEQAGFADGWRSLAGFDLQQSTVLDRQQALAEGRLSSEALVAHELERIARYDRDGARLNAVRALAPDAVEQARAADARRAAGATLGPLDGLTVLLKDNIGTRDLPTTAGSIALADNIPLAEAFITTRLREAGAIVLGKANLSEFANWMDLRMPNGYSSLGGQVIAPYDFEQDPSGSSTGPGVAAAMAYAAVTVGSETSGSIISPATAHSLVGVKPTLGLVSRVGIIPLAHSFDTAGPMTRNVTDAAVLLKIIAGVDPADDASPAFVNSPLAGVVPDYLAALKPDALQGARLGVREADLGGSGRFTEALTVLEALGAVIVPFDGSLPPSEGSLLEIAAIPNEFKWYLNRYLAEEAGPGLPVETLSDIIAFNQMFPEQVRFGQTLLIASDAQTGSPLDPVFLASRNGAILSSQLYIDGTLSRNGLDAIVGPNSANTSVTAAAGYPNVTVPMGYNGSLPQGLAFAGGAFSEAKLLAYAYAYEQATRLRRPPTEFNPELPVPCTDA